MSYFLVDLVHELQVVDSTRNKVRALTVSTVGGLLFKEDSYLKFPSLSPTAKCCPLQCTAIDRIPLDESATADASPGSKLGSFRKV